MVHQKVVSLQPQKGTLPEWLGIGLQNRGRRFESARYLKSLLSFGRLFLCVEDTLSYLPHMQCGAETQPLLVLSVSETRYIDRSCSPLLEEIVPQLTQVLSVSETRYIDRSCSPLLEEIVPQLTQVLGLSETRYIVRSWLHTTGVSGIPADAGTQRVGDMLLCQVMAPRS